MERMLKARPTLARLGSFRQAEAAQFKQVTAGAESRQFVAQKIYFVEAKEA
jgi:hypothetical protein